MHRVWVFSIVALIFAPVAAGQFSTELPRPDPVSVPQLDRFSEHAQRLLALPVPEALRTVLRGVPEVLNELNKFEPSPGDLINTWRTRHAYANNLRHLSTYSALQYTGLTPLYRTVRTYDDQSRLSELRFQLWEDDQFVPWARALNAYSGSAVTPDVVLHQWFDGLEYQNFLREVYTVSGDGTYYTAVRIDVWDAGWEPDVRFSMVEANGGVIYTIEVWSGTAWLHGARLTVPGLTIPQLVSVIAAISEMEEDMLGIYLPMAFIPDHVFEAWDGSGWVPEDRQTSEYFYDTPGGTLLRVETTLEEYTGAGWDPFGRMVRWYDVNPGELLDLFEIQLPDGASWTTLLTESYEYSDSDRLTMLELAVASDFRALGAGLELAALITYDWGEPAVGSESPAPGVAFGVDAVFPNPIVTTGVVRFHVAEISDVRLEVFDLLGRRVAILTEGQHAAGRHEAAFDVSGVPAGTYIVRLQTEAGSTSRTMTVVR